MVVGSCKCCGNGAIAGGPLLPVVSVAPWAFRGGGAWNRFFLPVIFHTMAASVSTHYRDEASMRWRLLDAWVTAERTLGVSEAVQSNQVSPPSGYKKRLV